MTDSDVPAMARLHMDVFPGYFLTLMGRQFIELYYRQYLEHPHAYTGVALDGECLVGFIVGGRDISDLERSFYRRNFLALGVIIATRFVTRRAARTNLWERRGVVRRAIREVLGGSARRGSSNSRSRDADGAVVQASILVIAVDDAYRGRGVGRALNASFLEAARADGVQVLRSTVRRDNPSHVARKQKTGWQAIYTDDKKVLFTLDITESTTDGT